MVPGSGVLAMALAGAPLPGRWAVALMGNNRRGGRQRRFRTGFRRQISGELN